MAAPSYVFTRGQRSIVAEVLFPKKVEYQGQIFRALQEGLDEEGVKKYLSDEIDAIVQEMKDYPQLFDPRQYGRGRRPTNSNISREQTLQRIEMYQSHFKGWSMYEVDGVFLNELNSHLNEERTQVIRLIFQPESNYTKEARTRGCYDVLEALIRWVMAEHMRLDHILPWSREEELRFLTLHGSWPRRKRRFVEEYYERITKEAKKWIDDVSLFIFAYLVRRFWVQVVKLGRREDEIWVTTFFTANLNTVRRIHVT